MWTGLRALQGIDQSLQTVRNEVVRLDKQLSLLTGQVTMNQRHKLSLLNSIAEVRLGELERGELKAEFDAADARSVEILQRRESAFNALLNEINELNSQIRSSESERESMLDHCNQTSQQIVDVEAQVQEALKTNEEYLRQFKAAQDAESVSEEAERKVEQANADMAEKAKPYQDDPLFMYLWGRGFGTTEYNGGLFSRFMDGWVARLIKYEPARVNFWNLNEIPKRLTEHADHVGDMADQAMLELQELESAALNAAGAKTLEQSLQDSRAALDEHDDLLEQLEAGLNNKLSERTAFSAGDDEYTQQCLARLAAALEHQNLSSIYHYVRQTNSPVDDRIVLELKDLEDGLESLRGDLSGVRKLHDKQIDRLRELESVRSQFKNSRFDDVRSGFNNEALIASVLSQFIQGVVSGSDLWGTLKRNQRYRNVGSSPDFGSGGLGDLADMLGDNGVDIGDILRPSPRRRRQRRGSTWHLPQPRRGGGGFKFPRSTGRSGGGFKTGGGF